MKEYKIEKLDYNQFDVLIPLMKSCFGLETDIEYFKWKFLDNPAGTFVGFIAKSELDEVAAYYGVIPERYYIEGEEHTLYQSCDTMTHPEHRRKGLFQKLATHCFDYLKSNSNLNIIGFSGEESTPGFIKFGWSHLFDMRNYFYPKQLNFQNKPISEVIESESLNVILPLVKKSNSKCSISLIKDESYLIWRYSNPNRRYSFLTLDKSFISYYIESKKIFIMDYYFSSSTEAKKLLKQLKYILNLKNLQAIVIFIREKSDDSNQFRSLGFIFNPFKKGPLSYKVPFIVLAEENSRLFNSNSWLPRAIDHDAM